MPIKVTATNGAKVLKKGRNDVQRLIETELFQQELVKFL